MEQQSKQRMLLGRKKPQNIKNQKTKKKSQQNNILKNKILKKYKIFKIFNGTTRLTTYAIGDNHYNPQITTIIHIIPSCTITG